MGGDLCFIHDEKFSPEQVCSKASQGNDIGKEGMEAVVGADNYEEEMEQWEGKTANQTCKVCHGSLLKRPLNYR